MESAPIRMVGVSACVNFPLHHKSRSSVPAPAHPGGPGKRAVKRLRCVVVVINFQKIAVL